MKSAQKGGAGLIVQPDLRRAIGRRARLSYEVQAAAVPDGAKTPKGGRPRDLVDLEHLRELRSVSNPAHPSGRVHDDVRRSTFGEPESKDPSARGRGHLGDQPVVTELDGVVAGVRDFVAVGRHVVVCASWGLPENGSDHGQSQVGAANAAQVCETEATHGRIAVPVSRVDEDTVRSVGSRRERRVRARRRHAPGNDCAWKGLAVVRRLAIGADERIHLCRQRGVGRWRRGLISGGVRGASAEDQSNRRDRRS